MFEINKELIIKVLEIKHLTEILEINFQTKVSLWTDGQFSEEIENEYSRNFGLFDQDNKLLAFSFARLITNSNLLERELELFLIAVKPQYYRKGLATILLKHLVYVYSTQSSVKIFLEVRSKNSSALSFYQSFGFKTDFARKNYYTNPTDDALVMSFKSSG